MSIREPLREKKPLEKSSVADHMHPMSPAVVDAMNMHYDDFKHYLERRLGDKTTAEDVLQNFYVRVIQSKTKLRDERSAIGWLYTVLRSVLIDHYRRDSVRKRGDARYAQEQIVLENSSVNPEEMDNICNCVHGLLLELQPGQAELLNRIDFLEEPRKKVGADMDISQQHLRVRLHRARLAIGTALKKHCGACCEIEYRDCFCESDCTHTDPFHFKEQAEAI